MYHSKELVKGQFIDEVLKVLENIPLETMEGWLDHLTDLKKNLKVTLEPPQGLKFSNIKSADKIVHEALLNEQSSIFNLLPDPVIYPFEEESEFPTRVFPVWKRISSSIEISQNKELIDDFNSINTIANSFDNIDVLASIITSSVECGLSEANSKNEIDLIRLNPKELGFNSRVAWKDIYYRADKYGLTLCPKEIVLCISLDDIISVEPYIGITSLVKPFFDVKLLQLKCEDGHKILSVRTSQYLEEKGILFDLGDNFIFTPKNED